MPDDVFIAQNVPEAQTRQTVSLGERARHEHILEFLDQPDLGFTQTGILNVGLIDDERYTRLGNGDEVLRIHEIAGGVVGVGDDDDLGFLGNRLQDRTRIKEHLLVLVDHGHRNQAAAQDIAAQLVDTKTRGVLDDFFACAKEAAEDIIEYFTGALSSAGAWLAHAFYADGVSSTKMFNILGVSVKPAAKAIISLLGSNALFVIPASILLLFASLRGLSVMLKKILIGKSQENLEKYVFGSPFKSLVWGTGLTAAVQSSSVTTSLIVPLVATDKISLRKAFPFLMGANIGTTVTALIAAISQTEAALAVALCHLLFNLFGVLILFPIGAVRNLPIYLAELLGHYAGKKRMVGIAYIAITFFLIPFTLIYSTSNFSAKAPEDTKVIEVPVQPVSAASTRILE